MVQNPDPFQQKVFLKQGKLSFVQGALWNSDWKIKGTDINSLSILKSVA